MEVSVLLNEPNMTNQESDSDHMSDLPSAQSSSSFSLLVSIVLEMIPPHVTFMPSKAWIFSFAFNGLTFLLLSVA